jgi:hypothetical protein
MNVVDSDGRKTPELRTAAIAVWHYEQLMVGSEAWAATLRTSEEQARRVERLRAELHRIIGERDDIIFSLNGGCVEAEVEDLRFVALEFPASKPQEHQPVVTLVGRCPSCAALTISEPFYSLAGLGKMLEKFEPIYMHPCFDQQ